MPASSLVNTHARAFHTRFGRVWVVVCVGLCTFPFTRYSYGKKMGGSIVIHLVDTEPEPMPDWSPQQRAAFREAHLCREVTPEMRAQRQTGYLPRGLNLNEVRQIPSDQSPAQDWNHTASQRHITHVRVMYEHLTAIVAEALERHKPGKGDLACRHTIRFTTVDTHTIRVTTYTDLQAHETLIGAKVLRPLDAAMNLWVLRDLLREASPHSLLRLGMDKLWDRRVDVLALWQSDQDYTHWYSRIHLFPTDELPKRKAKESA